MALSMLERKHWREQLMYADRVWYRAGILDDTTGTYREPNTVPVYRYIQDYRGDQGLPFSGAALSDTDRIVVNLAFSVTNSVMSRVSARDPEPIVKARGGSMAREDVQRSARVTEILLRMVMREMRFKREIDRALLCALTAPFGLIRHGYTPDVEEYSDGEQVFARFKNERPAYPWVRYYSPWDVRVDPIAQQFDPDQSPRWVAFRDLYTELEVKKNSALIARKDWTPTFTPTPFMQAEKKVGQMLDAPMLYEAWWVYDADERKVFAVSPGAEREVSEVKDWPIEWGQLPYSILTLNEQLDSPVGIPLPKMYANELAMYNRVWTTLNVLLSRVRRLIVANGSAFTSRPDQLENLLNPDSLVEAIVADSDPTAAVREIAFGVIDPQLVGLLYQIKESIFDTIGVAPFDRGQRANVETATEAGLIGGGAAAQKGRVQEKFEAFWANAIAVAHRTLQQIRDDRVLNVPLEGEENSTRFTEDEVRGGFAAVRFEQLRGDYDIAVRLNSTLPLDTAQEAARAATVFQLLGGPNSRMVDQYNAQRDLVDLFEQDPDKWIVSREVLAQQAAQQQAAQQGGAESLPGANASELEQRGTDAAHASLMAALPSGVQ